MYRAKKKIGDKVIIKGKKGIIVDIVTCKDQWGEPWYYYKIKYYAKFTYKTIKEKGGIKYVYKPIKPYVQACNYSFVEK